MGDTPEDDPVDPKSLIAEEDVKETLLCDKGEEAALISWEVVDFTKTGDNYSTFVTSIQVTYSMADEELQVSYVTKVNPCRKLEGFESITHALFEKEVNFYLNLVPDLNSVLEEAGIETLNLPRCYHVNLDQGQERAYYEDLRERGFKMVDRRQGLDAAHVTLVLKELAKLHAASRLLQEKSPEESLEEKYYPTLQDWLNLGEEANEVLTPMLQGYLNHARDILKNSGGEKRILEWIESLRPNLREDMITKMQSDTFGSICHGDCWSNNILFRYEDEEPVEVMLVDLEACRYATLASELNYLLYSSVAYQVRKENLEDFMRTYFSAYNDIVQAGGLEMSFSEEELMEEFRDKNILGAIFAMMIVPIVLFETGELPHISEFSGDFEEAINDFWARVKSLVDESPLLRPRFLDMFEEFTETGLIPLINF
ncbi:uncharacterized protein LOC135225483 isoform X2 [Macrobrachium nipponense]|uniref:uncharacterized protein LOC135225483 isoform X2 n=1 Tax=Macrobrachium nipponense TaxID=159736 RepID=UPI0030C8340D